MHEGASQILQERQGNVMLEGTSPIVLVRHGRTRDARGHFTNTVLGLWGWGLCWNTDKYSHFLPALHCRLFFFAVLQSPGT